MFWEQHTHARGIIVTGVNSDLSAKASLPGVTYQLPGSFLDMCVCVCVCPAEDKLCAYFFFFFPNLSSLGESVLASQVGRMLVAYLAVVIMPSICQA